MRGILDGIDENRSVWAAGKPPYQPLPALARDTDCDVAIIGGGFTGVSTALHLAERFPERRVVLLEARVLGAGASGRNGGMMLNGVNGVHASDGERARRIFDVTREGIELVCGLIRDHGLAVGHRRDGCVEVLTDGRRAEAAAREVESLRAAGLPLEFWDERALASRLGVAGARGAVFDPTAGVLDGVDYLRALRPLLIARGVAVHESTPVLRVREGAEVLLETPSATVRARAIVLATNAYTPRLGYFRDTLVPLLSHVVATNPLPPERWAALGIAPPFVGFSDDLDRLSYGAITPRGELLFGGGLNAAYRYRYGGRTDAPAPESAASARAEAALRRQLGRYFPSLAQGGDVDIAHRWAGPVALTMSRVCAMGVRGAHRNVYYALGYSGHGVALANLAGRVLRDIYSDDDGRWRDMPFYQPKLLRVPPEPLRWAGYHVYTALTGRSPRREAMLP